jgi:hypothetical protein
VYLARQPSVVTWQHNNQLGHNLQTGIKVALTGLRKNRKKSSPVKISVYEQHGHDTKTNRKAPVQQRRIAGRSRFVKSLPSGQPATVAVSDAASHWINPFKNFQRAQCQ